MEYLNDYNFVLDTIYVYKKLLSVKYHPMVAKKSKYSLCYGWALRKLRLQAAEHQSNDCSLGETRFEGVKVPNGSSSIRKTSGYKPRSRQKGFISVSTAFRTIKEMREKNLRCSEKSLLSASIVQKRLERNTRLLNNLKKHWN